MISKGKKVIAISVPEDRLKMIKEMARKEDLTVSQYLSRAGTVNYDEWLKNQNQKIVKNTGGVPSTT